MNRQRTLLDRLRDYAATDCYPFHMPGHKRRVMPDGLKEVMAIDITEIDGFDNLHDAAGILKEAQEDAARLYQADETAFLVNGSTCGLLSAIAGVCTHGGKIAVARNCHQSVYHALAIGHLKPVYLYPHTNRVCGIAEGFYSQDVEKLWITHPDIQAIVITSPTYHGVVADIRKICEIAHANKTPVIVDEAHGAHMMFHDYFPESAISCGADVVIQSTHKTLPMMTQTALLHINGSLVDSERIHRMLSIYQTSSPSYVLMSSIDAGLKMVSDRREALFDPYTRRLHELRNTLSGLKHLQLFEPSMLDPQASADYDRSKILIMTGRTDLIGKKLSQILRERYHLEMEMAAPEGVLAMTSIGDDEEGYRRLAAALKEIDDGLCISGKEVSFPMIPEAESALPMYEAMDLPCRDIPLDEASGMISAKEIYLYPPDIPLVTPGEVLTKDITEVIRYWQGCGFTVSGLGCLSDGRVTVSVTEG